MSKPEINARLEHVTRKPDRRQPEAAGHGVALAWEAEDVSGRSAINQDQLRVLRRALHHQMFRLEEERNEENLRKSGPRPYVARGIQEEIDTSQQLLNTVETVLRQTLGLLGAGAMKAGGGDAAEG